MAELALNSPDWFEQPSEIEYSPSARADTSNTNLAVMTLTGEPGRRLSAKTLGV
jgi:hypothetical protein